MYTAFAVEEQRDEDVYFAALQDIDLSKEKGLPDTLLNHTKHKTSVQVVSYNIVCQKQ